MPYIEKRNLFKRLRFELEQIFGSYWKGRFYKFSSIRENKYLIVYKKEPDKLGSEREHQFISNETDFIDRANKILSLYGKNSILYAGRIYFAYDYGIKKDKTA